jgi:DNA adenine methylase
VYDEILAGWRKVQRTALADGARERTEVLWMNFEDEADLFASDEKQPEPKQEAFNV